MLIQRSANMLHCEMNIDTNRLWNAALVIAAFAFLIMLITLGRGLSFKTGEVSAQSLGAAPAQPQPPAGMSTLGENPALLSAPVNAGITGDEDQPYFIQSP